MKIDTLCVQGGYQPKCGEPRQVPIYQTTTFKYDTTKHMGDLFDLKASGYFYTRLANPTNDLVAKNRDEAYKLLRKQGIRPYRVIGDDPWNWRPWAISAGYVLMSVALVLLGVIAVSQARQLREYQMLEAEEDFY